MLVSERASGGLCGFAEVGLRSHAEGCLTSPVGYLEGIWVDPEYRRRGVGRALLAASQTWARERGATEMGSDAALGNQASHFFHRAAGFQEVDRVVCFRRSL